MILGEPYSMIRDMARQFAAEHLMPYAADWERTATIPHGVLKEIGNLGLLGMMVPEAWGGVGLDNLAYVVALEQIAGGDGGVSTIMSVNNSPVCTILTHYGTVEQKVRFLKPLACGEMIGAFALTEPQAGSDASNLLTRARRDGDVYVLNGSKQFITSGQLAGLTIVFAVTDPDAGKHGISAFLVPTDTPGYHVATIEKKMGQNTSDTCHLVFEEMAVSLDLRIGEEGEGYKIALANLETGRIGVAAQAVGMANAAYEHALAYAKERTSFGKPIIEHQAVGFRLADMATQLEAARQLVYHAATLKDAQQPCLQAASMAKLFASEIAERVCSDAIQIHGGYGYLNAFPVERIYRDVRVCQIYEGTSDIQRLVISRSLAASASATARSVGVR
jgi:alkylation response protein AidB-like acyl-CoA dehydrogenase